MFLQFSILACYSQDTTDFFHQNFERTKDPLLGYPPSERLQAVRDKISQSQTLNGAIPNLHWFERGPNNTGGRTRAIMFDPFVNSNNDPFKKVWAGGVGGGLWWTDDITIPQPLWNKVSELWDNLSISCITTDPFRNNGNDYYVGTGEAWWTNGNNQFVAPSGGGVFKGTNNNGVVTWSSAALPATKPNIYPEFKYIQKILFAEPFNIAQANSDMFIATANGGVQYSNDGGNTFNQILGTSTIALTDAATDLELGMDKTVYAAMGGIGLYGTGPGNTDGIYRKDFGSNVFVNITPPSSLIGTSFGRINIEASGNNPNTIYALVNKNNIFLKLLKSLDKGITWSNIILPSIATQSTLWFSMAFEVNNFDDNLLSIGSIDLFLSDDGGANFIRKSQSPLTSVGLFPLIHEFQHEIISLPRITPPALFCNSGGVYYTNEFSNGPFSSNSIDSKNTGYNVSQLYSCSMKNISSDNYYLVSSHDAKVQVGNSPAIANTNSISTQNTSGYYQTFIDQDNPNFQIVTLRGTESFQYSTNSGSNWQQNNSQGNSFSPPWCSSIVNSPYDFDSKENTLFTISTDFLASPTACTEHNLVRYFWDGTSFIR